VNVKPHADEARTAVSVQWTPETRRRFEWQVATRSAVAYPGVRERLHRDRLADVVPLMIGEVSEFLSRHHIPPVGAPLVRL
jgi:hypothetical protein